MKTHDTIKERNTNFFDDHLILRLITEFVLNITFIPFLLVFIIPLALIIREIKKIKDFYFIEKCGNVLLGICSKMENIVNYVDGTDWKIFDEHKNYTTEEDENKD